MSTGPLVASRQPAVPCSLAAAFRSMAAQAADCAGGREFRQPVLRKSTHKLSVGAGRGCMASVAVFVGDGGEVLAPSPPGAQRACGWCTATPHLLCLSGAWVLEAVGPLDPPQQVGGLRSDCVLGSQEWGSCARCGGAKRDRLFDSGCAAASSETFRSGTCHVLVDQGSLSNWAQIFVTSDSQTKG